MTYDPLIIEKITSERCYVLLCTGQDLKLCGTKFHLYIQVENRSSPSGRKHYIFIKNDYFEYDPLPNHIEDRCKKAWFLLCNNQSSKFYAVQFYFIKLFCLDRKIVSVASKFFDFDFSYDFWSNRRTLQEIFLGKAPASPLQLTLDIFIKYNFKPWCCSFMRRNVSCPWQSLNLGEISKLRD